MTRSQAFNLLVALFIRGFMPLLVTILLASYATPLLAWGGGGGTPPRASDSPGPGGCPGDNDGGSDDTGGGDGCGSPVDLVSAFTGDLVIWDIPVFYESVGDGVPFVLSYSTQSGRSGVFGAHWTHSYNAFVVNDAPYGASVVYGDSREYYFASDGSGGYISPASVFDMLQYYAGGWLHRNWRGCCGFDGPTNPGLMPELPEGTTFTFDSVGQLTQIKDANGLTWTLSYSSGLLSTVTDPAGRQTTFQYTGGLLTRVTVPGGLYATFQYDTYTPKRLWKITDALGDTYTFGYSGTKITSITDPSGKQVWYTYGTFNNKTVVTATGVTNVPGSTVTYEYLPQANGQLYVDITRQKDGAAQVTRRIYEFTDDAANGRYYGTLLQTVVDPGGLNLRSAQAYDSQHRPVRLRDSYTPETGGKAHRHFLYYQDTANPNRVTRYVDPENSDGGETGEPSTNCPSYRVQYDGMGNLTKITTPESRVTDLTYVSGTRRLSSVIIRDQDIGGNPVDRTTSFTYWDSSKWYRPKTVTDARANTTTLYYDANGYLDYIDPPLGNNVEVGANSVGDITAVTDGNGNTTSYQYDGNHRLTQITYPDVGAGQKTKLFDWLCCGLDQVTDENGRITKLGYEPYTNRLSSVIEDYGGLNYQTSYYYDEVGNLTDVTNARGKTTTYTYDDADRLTRADYPDGAYETWTLRDDGRVYQHRDGRGRVTTYRYDADDRLAGSGSYVAINYPNDTDVKIVRDEDGLITSFTDVTGTSSAVYYPSTWLKSFTNGAGKTVTYEYNGVGLVGRLIAPDTSKWFTYNYDARNLLSSVVDQDSTTLSSFTYDNGGRRTQASRPGGFTNYGWNARNWITWVCSMDSQWNQEYRAYYYYHSGDGTVWDHVGNPIYRSEYFPGTSNFISNFRYDHLYRLSHEDRAAPGNYSLDYTYDQVGNRTSRVKDGVTVTYSYDDNDKLLSASDGSSFGYDGAGNMTSVSGPLGSWGLTYDDESRLCVVTYPHDGGSATDYHWYNALGQRTRAKLQNDAQCISYVYNGDRVLEENCVTGSWIGGRYATESGSYFAPLLQFKRATGESRFPLYDGIGTVRGLADAAGNVTDLYTLDAFGAPHGSTGTTPNPYKYGGAWGYITDTPGSGLLQLGQRYYWPEIGRFVHQDPLGDGMNWYAYVGNSPTVYVDPYGLLKWKDIRGPVVAFAGVVAGAVGEAAQKAGDAAQGAWRTAGTYAKGTGVALSLIGGYLTYRDTKAKADQAIGATVDRINNPEGTADDGTLQFLEDEGLGRPEDWYTGNTGNRELGDGQQCPAR